MTLPPMKNDEGARREGEGAVDASARVARLRERAASLPSKINEMGAFLERKKREVVEYQLQLEALHAKQRQASMDAERLDSTIEDKETTAAAAAGEEAEGILSSQRSLRWSEDTGRVGQEPPPRSLGETAHVENRKKERDQTVMMPEGEDMDVEAKAATAMMSQAHVGGESPAASAEEPRWWGEPARTKRSTSSPRWWGEPAHVEVNETEEDRTTAEEGEVKAVTAEEGTTMMAAYLAMGVASEEAETRVGGEAPSPFAEEAAPSAEEAAPGVEMVADSGRKRRRGAGGGSPSPKRQQVTRVDAHIREEVDASTVQAAATGGVQAMACGVPASSGDGESCTRRADEPAPVVEPIARGSRESRHDEGDHGSSSKRRCDTTPRVLVGLSVSGRIGSGVGAQYEPAGIVNAAATEGIGEAVSSEAKQQGATGLAAPGVTAAGLPGLEQPVRRPTSLVLEPEAGNVSRRNSRDGAVGSGGYDGGSASADSTTQREMLHTRGAQVR